jgi:hypothetical protein
MWHHAGMRVPVSSILDGLGWVVILLLVAACLGLVRVLGFPGVLILGLLCSLVCVRAELSDEVPSWGRHLFAARMARDARRARPDESPFRFGLRCGLALTLAGLAGSLWQLRDLL